MRTKSKHVIAKRLKDGTVAYYWNAPPWFRQLHNDIPASLPLGDDLKEAKETINAPQRQRREVPSCSTQAEMECSCEGGSEGTWHR